MAPLREILIWAIIGTFGISLLFDGPTRNQFYTSFSYRTFLLIQTTIVFNTSTAENQDISETLRLVSGILMSLAFFNILGGIVFRCISILGFVFYVILSTSDLVIRKKIDIHDSYEVICYLVLFLMCLDSVVNEILRSEQKQKEKKRKLSLELKNKQLQTGQSENEEKATKSKADISGAKKNKPKQH